MEARVKFVLGDLVQVQAQTGDVVGQWIETTNDKGDLVAETFWNERYGFKAHAGKGRDARVGVEGEDLKALLGEIVGEFPVAAAHVKNPPARLHQAQVNVMPPDVVHAGI